MAVASSGDDPTVPEVPHNTPPRNNRPNFLRSLGEPGRARELPVNAAAPTERERGPSPMALIRPPVTGADECVVVSRRLDRGRLCSAEIVTATGWGPGLALAADVSNSGRVLLRVASPSPVRADAATRVVAGTHTAHTDARSMIVLTSGLRAFLGVGADGHVVALVSPDGHTVEILTAAVITAALHTHDTLNAIHVSRRQPAPTAVTQTA